MKKYIRIDGLIGIYSTRLDVQIRHQLTVLNDTVWQFNELMALKSVRWL